MTVKSTGASSTSPDLEEHRQADQEPRQQQREIEPPLAEPRHERPRHDDRAARFREQLADHGAQPDDQRDETQRVADALLKGPRDVGQRHPGAEPDDDRSDEQRDERRQAQPGDEQHHECDAGGGNQQKYRGISGSHGASA